MDNVRHDLRFAMRSLFRQPGYTFVTILTLALGVGANTAIFSVVNRVLLRPLPFPDSGDVMVMWEQADDGGQNQVSPPNYFDWRERNRAFAAFGFSWFSGWETITGRSPTRASTEMVSRDFWDVFQATPYLGRTIAPEENRPGGDPTAVVSYGFWLNHLGADSALADLTLQVQGTVYQVVGVMPPAFRYQGDTDIWLPAELGEFTLSRTTHYLRVIGRLAPGWSIEEARRDMKDVARRVKQDHPESTATSVFMIPMQEQLVGDTRRPLYLLLGAAGLLLLIGCTNVASTLLAQGTARQREIAIRTSLGAGRRRIVGQLLTESVLLATLGAAAGLAMAAVVVRALVAMAPSTITRIDTISLDLPVVVFAVVAGAATALLFGLLPALRGSEADATTVLRGGSTGIMSGRSKLWGALVGTEVAFALLLLVGSGLLLRSFWALTNVDLGFEPEGVLTVEMSLPASRYAFGPPVAAFHERFLDEMATVPGVTATGIINHLPLGGLSIFAGISTLAEATPQRGRYRLASGGVFAALGIPILRGRGFSDADRPGVPHAIVLNQSLSQELFPDSDPLGQQVKLTGNDAHAAEWLTVVGIAADIRHGSLAAYEPPSYYVHYLQRPAQGRNVVAALRTDGDPSRLIPIVQQRLRDLDDQIPVEFATMTSVVSQSVADRRFTIVVLGTFAGVALVLAMMGIFGVVSYTVATRTRELGIRLALGAEPVAVRNMVVRQSMATVGLGLAAGAVTAVVLTRLLRNMLFDVNPTDPATFLAVAVVLGGAAWLASYLPARRSTRIDPMQTIRTE